jgi:hypothetical protein
MNRKKLGAAAVALVLIQRVALAATGGAFTGAPTTVASMNDGSVLVYVNASGAPNFCGGAAGDFVVPPTVSEATRSRMLAIALSAKVSNTALQVYYDGTCFNGRHVTYILLI